MKFGNVFNYKLNIITFHSSAKTNVPLHQPNIFRLIVEDDSSSVYTLHSDKNNSFPMDPGFAEAFAILSSPNKLIRAENIEAHDLSPIDDKVMFILPIESIDVFVLLGLVSKLWWSLVAYGRVVLAPLTWLLWLYSCWNSYWSSGKESIFHIRKEKAGKPPKRYGRRGESRKCSHSIRDAKHKLRRERQKRNKKARREGQKWNSWESLYTALTSFFGTKSLFLLSILVFVLVCTFCFSMPGFRFCALVFGLMSIFFPTTATTTATTVTSTITSKATSDPTTATSNPPSDPASDPTSVPTSDDPTTSQPIAETHPPAPAPSDPATDPTSVPTSDPTTSQPVAQDRPLAPVVEDVPLSECEFEHLAPEQNL